MLKDLFFPKTCLACGFIGSYVCLRCQKKMQSIVGDPCLYCGKKSYLGLTHPVCKRKKGIDGIMSIFYYGPTVRAIIKNIKYRGVYDACNELFLLLNDSHMTKYFEFKKIKGQACLQSIPLHKNRMRARGFNQSEIISNFFSYLLHYKKLNILERIKETQPQAQLKNRFERMSNVESAFSIQPGKSVLSQVVLIDDVVTTGNTVKEAAKVLKQAGASQVFVFSLARG